MVADRRDTPLTAAADDAGPDPVEVIEAAGSPLLLVCEHAGNAAPADWSTAGMAPGAMESHAAWDIGAGDLTRRLAAALGATAVLQRYSRLVIDCNRPPDAPDAMPAVSHGVAAPANAALTAAERAARRRRFFDPFHDRVAALLDGGARAAFAIHSFTPRLGGALRPWDVGLLFRHDTATSAALRRRLAAADPSLLIGMNEPYPIDDASDWFVPRQAEPRGLPHSLIEIRNDLIAHAAGRARWAALLAGTIRATMEEIAP